MTASCIGFKSDWADSDRANPKARVRELAYGRNSFTPRKGSAAPHRRIDDGKKSEAKQPGAEKAENGRKENACTCICLR
jgi:hypothetical protein